MKRKFVERGPESNLEFSRLVSGAFPKDHPRHRCIPNAAEAELFDLLDFVDCGLGGSMAGPPHSRGWGEHFMRRPAPGVDLQARNTSIGWRLLTRTKDTMAPANREQTTGSAIRTLSAARQKIGGQELNTYCSAISVSYLY